MAYAKIDSTTGRPVSVKDGNRIEMPHPVFLRARTDKSLKKKTAAVVLEFRTPEHRPARGSSNDAAPPQVS